MTKASPSERKILMNQDKLKIIKKNTNQIKTKYFASIKVCDCGDTLEVKLNKTKRTGKFNTRRISRDQYVDIRTGEVFEYNNDYEKSIYSFFTIKRTIIRNFKGTLNERFVTLTYAEKMYDNKLIADDFKAFWRKFKRKYPNCEYVRIAEPHRDGSWHIHLLVKDTINEYLNLLSSEITKLWGNGYAHIEMINNIYGLANYFIPSTKSSASKSAQDKAQRLKYYTKYFRNFTYSSGIVVPKFDEKDYEEYCNLIKNYYLKYSSGDKNIIELTDDGKSKLLNVTRFEEYVDKNSTINQISKPELSEKGEEV